MLERSSISDPKRGPVFYVSWFGFEVETFGVCVRACFADSAKEGLVAEKRFVFCSPKRSFVLEVAWFGLKKKKHSAFAFFLPCYCVGDESRSKRVARAEQFFC